MSETLERLEELTPKLPSLVMPLDTVGFVEYITQDGGYAIGFNLYSSPSVAVQRALLTEKTIFPVHCHDQSEVLVVYDGIARVRRGDQDILLGRGECCMFTPGEPHSISVEEAPLWVIGVSVPRAEGYPG